MGAYVRNRGIAARCAARLAAYDCRLPYRNIRATLELVSWRLPVSLCSFGCGGEWEVSEVEDWRGCVRSEVLDATADYAARGQKYRDMSDDDLSAAWVSSFKDVASDFTNPQLWSVQSDLAAEYGLRDVEPPYQLVAEDRIRLVTESKTMVEGLGPDDYERLDENVFMRFASFLAKLGGEQN
jgi:hypothetical protein